ncbi:hypothetical protein B7494_g8359 [Chlorociboria aeruginascens]|nr:hypothetical protein B7494_g8359 [Chlorociboria aeruginascens]
MRIQLPLPSSLLPTSTRTNGRSRASENGIAGSLNLDFDARVPIPFSIFPSSYRSDAAEQITQTHVEGEIRLPQGQQRVGREGQYSSFAANLPPKGHFVEEEVHISRGEDRYRPSRREDIYVREERRPEHKHTSAHIDIGVPHRRHYDTTEVDIEVDRHRPHHDSKIDIVEREYRSRFQPNYREEIRVGGTTVDPPRFQPSQREHIRVTEETIDPPRFQSNKMGYYDEDGHYHSFRHGLHRVADRVLHPIHGGHHHHHHHDKEEIDITIGDGRSEAAPRAAAESSFTPNTVTIPCHHIRMGDLLILQGRPCQVIRISTSNATGQHRYLGVDLFTKQLHEESSFISNPSPSVIVQTMLGPVFKQYRVLDLQDGTVVAMTETGDVKQALPVIDQSDLWSRLTKAFDTGRGSVRVLVISDNGRELAVDMKVVHGSRL